MSARQNIRKGVGVKKYGDVYLIREKAALSLKNYPTTQILNRDRLKNVFWPNIFVGVSFQILDNQQVACGLKLGPAAPVSAKPLFSGGEDGILNQNPIFEMADS